MNQRQQSLIYQLIEMNNYITIKKLAEHFHVSERTVHSDLNVIETWFRDKQLPLMIERKKGTGILLNGLPHEKEQLKRTLNEEAQTEMDKNQLRQLLIFHLLVAKDGFSLEELSEKLYVGKRTIRKELTELKSFFEYHHLQLVSKTKLGTFLEARLNRELPELTIIDLIEYKPELEREDFPPVDFILATLPFKHANIPVVEISPMMTENDLAYLTKYMLEHVPIKKKKTFDLASFTHPFLIFPQLEWTDPVDILNFMGNVLVEHHYVEPEFVDSVLERDRHSSTRVAPFVTIPHGNPLYVKHSMISIATMKEPILWHGEQIRIVLLLAIKRKDLKHAEFKKIFSVIHYLEKQPEQMTQLMQSNHPLEILTLLSSYE
ncbi:PTS sugar transporter subunit IIA [Enterococcus faecium]|uniref:PTS sugar transporter subunit IIA n=1 Tax=Enterococcus faecium TaxID=1352 RepID=UPI0023B2F014|nr:PTS sugar transporter subunit IIA [Enterococcus faecium]